MKKLLIILICSVLGVSLMQCNLKSNADAGDDLAKNFVSPPDEARIWVYWFWLNGNISKEGITADLEAMSRVGIGGVLIMEVDQGAPVGPVAFMSDEWRELFKFMVSEAARLNIEVNMNNDAGWNGSGGPWVPLDKTMQVVVTSELQVAGGSIFDGVLAQPQANGDFYRDIAVMAFPSPKDTVNMAYRIKDLGAKNMSWGGMYTGSLNVASEGEIPGEFIIGQGKIVDLTREMDSVGKISWAAPALPNSGNWTLIRFGHTFTGAKSHPAPATGAGPECDKLSKEGIEANYRGMIGKLVKDVGQLAGKTFAATHVDSWEIGSQNWTPRMPEEFKRLRGYDMMPYLPVLTGRIVESEEISERFLRDVRQTVSDLLVENYIGHLRTLANNDGLRLSMEAYSTPANDMDVANNIEEPISEFWWPGGGGFYWTQKSMSSIAHVNGLPIVGAEAFTSGSEERWLAHPASIKALGDRAFCDGINRFIVHRYAMQPWKEDRRPGMTMGPWGLHYERTQTWWEDSKAWHNYVARCQYMLRQGTFVADVLSLQSEEPMQRFKPLKMSGYDYDGISPQAFLKEVKTEDGMLKLHSGMKYRLLVLPEGEEMTPRMLKKITTLVEEGANILGNPPLRAPGLTGYPESDASVKKLVEYLWGNTPVRKREIGKGRVLSGITPSEALAELEIQPDFVSSRPIRYIHRTVKDKEIYFVANPDPVFTEALCSFRINDKYPEIWDPMTGITQAITVFEESDGITRIPLSFEPSGSVFIVFVNRGIGKSKQIISVKKDDQELTEIVSTEKHTDIREASSSFTMLGWIKPDISITLPRESNEGLAALSTERNDVVYPAPGHEVWTDKDAGVGFGAGRNGICVYEHSASYFPAILVYKAAISDWTHVALVYRDGKPSLYLNGKFVKEGLKSNMIVHGGMGVLHDRQLSPFQGLLTGLRQLPLALSPREIEAEAKVKPEFPQAVTGPVFDFAFREIYLKGIYEIGSADGKTNAIDATDLPDPTVINGPWEVSFTPGLGAPEKIIMDSLISWSDHEDRGVMYYSGDAIYRKTFDFSPIKLADQHLEPVIWLDLGKVCIMAEVKLNGKDLGILWKPPYRIDISDEVKAGENQLEIKLVNLLINRMIGDEQLPEDSKRNANGTLKEWPQWLLDGQPSPTGRFTFTTWRLWDKDSPLRESGLLGPVKILTVWRLL